MAFAVRSRSTLFLLLLLVFVAGVYLERTCWIPGANRPTPREYSPLWEARDIIQKNFVDRSRTTDDRLASGSVSGMVTSLGDRGHTAYLSAEQRKRLAEDLSGRLEGIGSRIAYVRQRPTIVQVMPGSPARAAGIRVGDVLEAIDGESLVGLGLGQIVTRVRGKPGSRVRLRLTRPGLEKPLDLSVPRARVEVPEVSWQLVPGEPKIAHIAFQRFTNDSAAQIRKTLEKLRDRGVQGIILDLRGNPGGVKDQAIAIAGEFLPRGTLVLYQEDADGKRTEVRTDEEGVWVHRPLTVLIDGRTGSSAEILAGALQDHHRARLVGSRTFGTGTVLREFALSDGSAVLLAIAVWLTPEGRKIYQNGIEPDKGLEARIPRGSAPQLPDDEVPLTEDTFATCDDEPLRKASQVLRKEIEAKK